MDSGSQQDVRLEPAVLSESGPDWDGGLEPVVLLESWDGGPEPAVLLENGSDCVDVCVEPVILLDSAPHVVVLKDAWLAGGPGGNEASLDQGVPLKLAAASAASAFAAASFGGVSDATAPELGGFMKPNKGMLDSRSEGRCRRSAWLPELIHSEPDACCCRECSRELSTGVENRASLTFLRTAGGESRVPRESSV